MTMPWKRQSSLAGGYEWSGIAVAGFSHPQGLYAELVSLVTNICAPRTFVCDSEATK